MTHLERMLRIKQDQLLRIPSEAEVYFLAWTVHVMFSADTMFPRGRTFFTLCKVNRWALPVRRYFSEVMLLEQCFTDAPLVTYRAADIPQHELDGYYIKYPEGKPVKPKICFNALTSTTSCRHTALQKVTEIPLGSNILVLFEIHNVERGIRSDWTEFAYEDEVMLSPHLIYEVTEHLRTQHLHYHILVIRLRVISSTQLGYF